MTTLLNQLVRITDEPTAQLLRLLDGTRDRAAILEAFPGPLDRARSRPRSAGSPSWASCTSSGSLGGRGEPANVNGRM